MTSPRQEAYLIIALLSTTGSKSIWLLGKHFATQSKIAQDSAKETGRTAEDFLIGAGREGRAYRRNKTPGAECT